MSASHPKRKNSMSDQSVGSSSSESVPSSLSGSNGTWAVPRSRTDAAFNTSAGPRRLGSSFRVSLRPNRHRKNHHSSGSNGNSIGDTDSMSSSMPFLSSAGGGLSQKLFSWALLGITLLIFIMINPPTPAGRLYNLSNIDEKLSTEDLVAQGEMSARMQTDDSLMPRLFEEGGDADDATKRSDGKLGPLNGVWSNLRGGLLGNGDASGGIQDSGELSHQPGRNPNVVAYVLPVFKCYGQGSDAQSEPTNDEEFHDAALMLQASIDHKSIRQRGSNSRYDYEMVALIEPSVRHCGSSGTDRAKLLQGLGYRVEVVRPPLSASEIRSQYIKDHVKSDPDGLEETIRLYAFQLTEYSIVVLVNFATLVLEATIDPVYDMLMNGPHVSTWIKDNPYHMVQETFYANGTTLGGDLPQELDVVFTRDYSTTSLEDWTTGMSLSFLPLRPNADLFERLKTVYRTTEFVEKFGWAGRGYGSYPGAMLTKGIVTYFFSEVAPDRKLELQRCLYGNMAENPFLPNKNGNVLCRDAKQHLGGQASQCVDCRRQVFNPIRTGNFALCQPPWKCPRPPPPSASEPAQQSLCQQYHKAWFQLRRFLEETKLQPEQRSPATGGYFPDIFAGYCSPSADGGLYTPMLSETTLSS